MDKKGLQLMADYVFLAKYSQKKENGELESWNETVDRIYSMHETKLYSLGLMNSEVREWLQRCKELEYQKKILSSQRGRQFASSNPNSGILKHEAKMYNCCSTLIDRPKVFSEIMYLLLCGCGVGYSLHKAYVDKLPEVKQPTLSTRPTYVIDDSIEGWADSINELMEALFAGEQIHFDYSKIREKGSLIDGKFIAPGPMPLRNAHENIRKVMYFAIGRKLTTLEVHDIICYIAEGVISGGVRRSAMIALFDKDDNLMLTAKTGSWWEQNPQRAMANNSMLISRGDALTYKEVKEKLQVVRQFGEPGFVNVPDYSYVVNPCGEIVMQPTLGDKTGFAFCNLVEINAECMEQESDFFEAVQAAAFIATVQSLYTNFKYLSNTSKEIAERDRAIGVSITGIFSNPWMFNPKLLLEGARLVNFTNARFAKMFNINASKRSTTIKPSGTASSILGLACSGIHPAHADKYLRRIRIKTYSPEYKALQNTPLVKLLRNDEAVISFPIVVDEAAILKDDISAVEHLKKIALVKHFWINKGIADGQTITNNVSATVEVTDDEWDEVAAVLYANDHLFTGISFLPKVGDQIYDNAPFQRLATDETKKEYDDAMEYLNNNDINFLEIMSRKADIEAADLTAIGCAGGACELK